MTTAFDPNAASSVDSGIFGLPYSEKESALVLVPVPWEATTSYGGGTSNGPKAIREASRQVDLFDLDILKPYEAGIFMRDESPEVRQWNETARTHAHRILAVGGDIGSDRELRKSLDLVNDLGGKLNEFVRAQTTSVLSAGKIPGIVGGDHSVPFGAFQAVADRPGDFGILHFDAHSDTRRAFEGFEWSHASIMYNALSKIPQITRLVQVGIRDVCEQEIEYVGSLRSRAEVHYDRDCARRKIEGITWAQIAREIIASLPNDVWVSFDIDGLDPKLCPHTGTPVPGGLEFQEANYVLATLVKSGRRIIGFDLNEVAPGPDGDEWDANVGSRLLYKLCAWTLASQSKAKLY